MTESLNNFEKNLRKQLDFYRKLNKLEKEKQEALVHNKIQKIDAVTAQEERILLEVSRLDEERLLWAEFFGKEIGKQAEELTMKDLAESFPSLESVRQELDQEILELKTLHETNTVLLENAVNLVNFTIQSLANDKQTTYSNPIEKGKKEPSNKLSNKLNLFDRSI